MDRERIIQKMALHLEEMSYYDCDEKCPVSDFCGVISTDPRTEGTYTCYEILTKVFNHINTLAKLGRRNFE